MSRADAGSRRAASSGFTLLEVLAAVAILSIWYIVIATSGIHGLRGEGESRRRLEAAMIADEALARVLASVPEGAAPEVGGEVEERGPYTIATRVGPFGVGPGPDDETEETPPPPPALPGEDAPPPDLSGLLGKELPGALQNLRTVSVQVTWLEGASEQTVYRTTWLFDGEKAANVYQGQESQLAEEPSQQVPQELLDRLPPRPGQSQRAEEDE